MEIRNKVIVVTGGASGIGAALCRRFAAEGARGVVVADRDGEAAQSVAKEIGGLAVPTDVAIEAEVVALADRAVAEFGPIDLFCSNAGIAAGGGLGDESGGPFSPDEDWERSWRVHVMAHVYATRAVLPAMLEQGEGDIVNISSTSGRQGRAFDAPYCASKFGVVGLSESLAEEVMRQGVRVQTVLPDAVETPLWEQSGTASFKPKELLSPGQVADFIIYLLGLPRDAYLFNPVVLPVKLRSRKKGRK